MRRLICRFFHRKHHFIDYEGRHIVTKKGTYRCVGCRRCKDGWYEKRPPIWTPCMLFGHRFYQGIAGYSSDGVPYPGKFCLGCDYSEGI